MLPVPASESDSDRGGAFALRLVPVWTRSSRVRQVMAKPLATCQWVLPVVSLGLRATVHPSPESPDSVLAVTVAPAWALVDATVLRVIQGPTVGLRRRRYESPPGPKN